MVAPIVLPQSNRYKTVIGIGALPGNVDTIQNIFSVDDNSFAIFSWSAGGGFSCWVLDVPTLAVTYYTSTVKDGALQTAPILFGAGNFMLSWNDGTFYFFRVQNLKLNNPSPILLSPSSTTIPLNACGAPFSKTFYDAVNNRLAFGYYNALNGSIFGSVYQVGGGVLARAASGFPGFWSILDTWDRTQATAPGARAQILTNNVSLAFGGNPTQVYRQRFFINLGIDQGRYSNGCYLATAVFPGVAQCNAAGYSVIEGPFEDGSVLGEIGPDNFSGQYVLSTFATAFNTGTAIAVAGMCDSNIPGLVGLSDANGVHIFGDGGVWFYIPVQFGTIVNAAITKNYIAGVISFEGMSIGIFQTPSGGQLYNGASVTKNTRKLSNYARPISVTGKYKA